MVNSRYPLGLLSIFTLISSLWSSSPSSEATWHLPLLGLPVAQSTRNPSQLRFFRHPNPKVRLTPRLPSLAITVTQKNILGAINPKNGTIVWRLLLPKNEPIIHYAVDLNNRRVAVISGENAIAVRLLSLSDGRLLWSRSLREGGLKQKDGLVGRVCDLVFTTDQHSDHNNFPDLIVLSHQSHAFRLSGHEGVIRWTWKTVDPTWNILRILEQKTDDQINFLLSKDESESTYITQVESVSSTTGSAYDQRPGSHQTCRKSGEPPVIVTSTSDSPASIAKSVVICIDHEGHISSALVPDQPTKPSQISQFSNLKHKHPALIDVGLVEESVFLAKLSDGSAIVLKVTSDGTLKSTWSFDPTDLPTKYAGSIDRDGLPYVSKVSFVPTLGLASLEILSLTPTERTPEGMVVGSTFGYDLQQNGPITGISVEVLQITNYTPLSRVMLVTGLGDIQLWQGETLQWERHEDLSLPASITLHQSKGFGGPLMSTDPIDIPRYVLQMTKVLFSGLLNFQSSKANPYNQSLANAYVWLIGSATGRLFAIVRDSNNEGKILWKRSLMSPGTVGSRTTLKWERLSFEGGHTGSYHPHVITSLQMDGSQTTFTIGLMDGEILNQTTITVPDRPQDSLVPKNKKLLAIHDRDMGGSPARFLGDRGALFKYLNPNLAVYFDDDFGGQTIEILDQKTGALIWAFEFSVKVDPASINAALTENWLVITSRETESGSTRINSIEWFMSSKADVRVDGSTANITSSARSYLTPFGIKGLGFTKSRLGVTSRALLVISDMDQIVSISRRLLDVRRPFTKPTTEEIEEFLLKYDPLIMIDPKSIISGDRPTKGLEQVYSFPTEFESTSAVIGVGLDLFATSTAPSRTFDMLGSDFNKAQLILTSAGLLLTTLILRPIVQKKQLKRQWYT
ncbi:hypothetical protein PGT21_033321 [Puccinia graminis f. sp. tritici]|uniref:ER membrane protein complex subunit 1 n=1 Tax=Puccinia graminis f. sp. tritici TaxID=56615 RepID=A0A5B0NHG6_PUCGR|nr:hypothetical protein PGT21_033321 [Puccinia graminis f. sp. tritici]